MARARIPNIMKLLKSKDFLIDAGIILIGFAILGAASALGTIGGKWVYNEYLRKYVPDSEKVPY